MLFVPFARVVPAHVVDRREGGRDDFRGSSSNPSSGSSPLPLFALPNRFASRRSPLKNLVCALSNGHAKNIIYFIVLDGSGCRIRTNEPVITNRKLQVHQSLTALHPIAQRNTRTFSKINAI